MGFGWTLLTILFAGFVFMTCYSLMDAHRRGVLETRDDVSYYLGEAIWEGLTWPAFFLFLLRGWAVELICRLKGVPRDVQ